MKINQLIKRIYYGEDIFVYVVQIFFV